MQPGNLRCAAVRQVLTQLDDHAERVDADRGADGAGRALDNLDLLGRDGRFVLAPCHMIQSITPPENVVAMYRAGFENGWL